MTVAGEWVDRIIDLPDAGSPLFVMAKEDEQWLLVACQNTGVRD
jgi:hypothetical protein